VLTVNKVSAVVMLPLLGVAIALGAHLLGGHSPLGGGFPLDGVPRGDGGFPGATNPPSQRGSAASRRRAGEPE
jgi:hypothetical protein